MPKISWPQQDSTRTHWGGYLSFKTVNVAGGCFQRFKLLVTVFYSAVKLCNRRFKLLYLTGLFVEVCTRYKVLAESLRRRIVHVVRVSVAYNVF